MPKRLLIVTQHFWPENFRVNDMAQGLVAAGIEVDVLCGLPNYPLGEWFEGYTARGPLRQTYEGAQIYRCREVPRKGNTALRIFANYVSWPLYAAAALRRLPGGYDAVLCYNTSPVLMCWPAVRAARRFKAPLYTYVLDIWPENLYSVLPVKNRFLRRVAKGVSDWLYRKADGLIAMSDGLCDRLRQRVGDGPAKRGGAPRRFAVIPQYCEDFYALPAPPDERLAQGAAGRCTLMFAGNLSPAQSLDTALQALAKATAAGADIRLVLVGDGMSRPALQELTGALDLADRVWFFGSVPPTQVPALAAAADGLVVTLADTPDLGLTVPAKLASCMAMAKPLLVSMSGEGAAAARDSGGALVSPAADAAALADSFVRFAALTPQQRDALGRRAFEYYQTHYRRDALLARLMEFVFPQGL